MSRPAPRARRAAASVVPALAALLAAASLAACSGPAPAATTASGPVDGGTLVYASGDAEPTCLDPHVGGNYPQALIASQVLEPLVGRDAEGTMTPWLATDWTVSEDGLTWDFTLADGIEFHDGTPFDAAAVKANVEHLKDPATKSSTGYLALAKVESVEVVDAAHARFHLSSPDSALLESISQPWLAIESPTGIARGEAENCAAPAGTGPFRVVEWAQQDRIVLERFEEYASAPAGSGHDGPAYLEEVEWRFIPDSATRYAALVSGEVDVIDNAQPDTIAQAESDERLVHVDAPRPGASNRLEFNTASGPFTDERVRQAFVRAVDVDAAIDALYFGTAERSSSALSSIEPDAYSDPAAFPVDVAEAERLLDEAGWLRDGDDGVRTRDGEPLVVRFPVSTNQSVPAEVSLFEQLQASAAQVGFDVEIELLDLSSWYGALAANEYDLVSAPYTKVGADVLRILYHSDGIVPAPSGYFANHVQVADPELDDLLTRAAQTTDAAERHDLYEQAQRILLDGTYILPIFDQQNHYLHRSDVAGFRTLDTVSTPTLYDAWLPAGS